MHGFIRPKWCWKDQLLNILSGQDTATAGTVYIAELLADAMIKVQFLLLCLQAVILVFVLNMIFYLVH